MTLQVAPTMPDVEAEHPPIALTQEDVWALERALDAAGKDGVRIEVTDGIPTELTRNMTYLHQFIIENTYDFLKPYVIANRLGRVHTAGLGFILIGTRRHVILRRYPDLSFIRAARLPKDADLNGDFVGAPDLALEVISPGQSNPYVFGKVSEYLNAGTEEVWLVYPHRRNVTQIRADADEPRMYKLDETIQTPLFPDFPIPVTALFNIPSETP
jgi:Uma2 family endonuclease